MGNPGGDAGEVSRVLAYVCRRRDYLRRLLSEDPGSGQEPAELRAVTVALIGPPPAGDGLRQVLQALDTAVQAAGDPLGVWEAGAPRGLRPLGVDDGVPFDPYYLCPSGRCAGRRPDPNTVFPMVCAVTGRELTRTLK